MADTNSLFQNFCGKITLDKLKRESLQTSRDNLRGKIKTYFTEKGKKLPKFCWQGSFAMKTIINPLSGGDYDIDDGIYLQGYGDEEKEKWPTPNTVHEWIKASVNNATSSTPINKDTCVRVIYAAGYHIDLPIYIIKDGVAYLAHKTKGWTQSDPKAFRDWFIEKVANEEKYGEQLRSIVKYMKAWKDWKEVDLKGIEITILATNNFYKCTGRDDKSLKYTLDNIIYSLENNFTCKKPVVPYEDLFEDASETKKNNILSALKVFRNNIDSAINEKDEKKASEYLRKSFGDRFPLGKESTESKCAAGLISGVINGNGRFA